MNVDVVNSYVQGCLEDLFITITDLAPHQDSIMSKFTENDIKDILENYIKYKNSGYLDILVDRLPELPPINGENITESVRTYFRYSLLGTLQEYASGLVGVVRRNAESESGGGGGGNSSASASSTAPSRISTTVAVGPIDRIPPCLMEGISALLVRNTHRTQEKILEETVIDAVHLLREMGKLRNRATDQEKEVLKNNLKTYITIGVNEINFETDFRRARISTGNTVEALKKLLNSAHYAYTCRTPETALLALRSSLSNNDAGKDWKGSATNPDFQRIKCWLTGSAPDEYLHLLHTASPTFSHSIPFYSEEDLLKMVSTVASGESEREMKQQQMIRAIGALSKQKKPFVDFCNLGAVRIEPHRRYDALFDKGCSVSISTEYEPVDRTIDLKAEGVIEQPFTVTISHDARGYVIFEFNNNGDRSTGIIGGRIVIDPDTNYFIEGEGGGDTNANNWVGGNKVNVALFASARFTDNDRAMCILCKICMDFFHVYEARQESATLFCRDNNEGLRAIAHEVDCGLVRDNDTLGLLVNDTFAIAVMDAFYSKSSGSGSGSGSGRGGGGGSGSGRGGYGGGRRTKRRGRRGQKKRKTRRLTKKERNS